MSRSNKSAPLPRPTDEWNTPEHIIEKARFVLGTIDCDPCTNTAAQSVINATTAYTVHDDGLAHPWYGNVWLNPPYSQPLMGMFVRRLIAESSVGWAENALLLTNNNTETEWFQMALAHCRCALLFNKRLRFWQPGDLRDSPRQGHALFLFNNKNQIISNTVDYVNVWSRFETAFYSMGTVIKVAT